MGSCGWEGIFNGEVLEGLEVLGIDLAHFKAQQDVLYNAVV